MIRLTACLFLISGLVACVHSKPAEKPRVMAPKRGTKDVNAKPVLGPETCKAFDSNGRYPPFYLPNQATGFVVTRLLKPCISRDGIKGFEQGSPWMAMGFPCTGGGGKIDWKGKSYAPKMVSWRLTIDCPIEPNDLEAIAASGRQALGFDQDAKLVAFYPFGVLFWEFEDYPDAGVGDVMEMRSVSSTKTAWSNFSQGLPLKVVLIGRENAWVRDKQFFRVEGYLKRENSQSRFRLQVLRVEVMTKDDLKDVYKRCQKLRREVDCGVFR